MHDAIIIYPILCSNHYSLSVMIYPKDTGFQKVFPHSSFYIPPDSSFVIYSLRTGRCDIGDAFRTEHPIVIHSLLLTQL